MKKLNVILAVIASLILAAQTFAQIGRDERKIIASRAELAVEARPKGWDGKVQGLFRNVTPFLHLQRGSGDYEALGQFVVDYFNRQSKGSRWAMSKPPSVRAFGADKYLVVKAEGREGRMTAFFPVTSESPQGIIVAPNGHICHAGNECAECSPNPLTHTCTCSDEKASPLSKCQYGGSIDLSLSAPSLDKLGAISVATVAGDGPVKFDKEVLAAQVKNIVPEGFQIRATEIKTIDKEYYVLSSLQTREEKSYLFITKLENQSGSLLIKSWGFLYHCEGMCGFSIPQCEATSPFIALNGQLSCGCNGHCAPKYGIIVRKFQMALAVNALHILAPE